MIVLYTATRNYYPYLQWTITSLLEHNKVSMLYVFAEDDTIPIEITCDNRIINVSDQKYFLPTSPNINTPYSAMSLMRVCAPEIIQEDKLLYLDVDTIICDDLLPLWETDIVGKWVAWCPERCGHWKPYGPGYCNAGILLMNLDQMRKDKVTDLIVNALNTKFYQFNEQDAMNELFPKDMTVQIDTRYNESFCCGYTDNPAIVHYAGNWNWYDSRSIYRWEYRAKYDK